MFTTTQSKLAATAAAIALAAGGGTLAASALAGSPTPIDSAEVTSNALSAAPDKADPAQQVFIAPPSAPPAYSALAKSKQRPTERVQYIAKVLSTRFPDLRASSAKGLAAKDGTQAWVVSGTSHVCLGADNSDGTGYTCATNAEAARSALSVTEERKDGSLRSVFLVPDNVSSVSAEGARSAASNNLVVAEYDRGAAVKAVFNDGTAAVSLSK